MSEGKVTVVATFKAKAGMEATTRDAIQALIAPTRAESGCINYDLHQSTQDPSIFMLYENWISKKDLQAGFPCHGILQCLGQRATG